MTSRVHAAAGGGPGRRRGRAVEAGQSTLEWVIGAAIILGTLTSAILLWNQGLATKIGELVSQLTK